MGIYKYDLNLHAIITLLVCLLGVLVLSVWLRKKFSSGLSYYLFCAFLTTIIVFVIDNQLIDGLRFQEDLSLGRCEKIVGVVNVIEQSGRFEKVEIGGVKFKIIDNSLPGYNKTSYEGGVLKHGKNVMICHSENRILSIDIIE